MVSLERKLYQKQWELQNKEKRAEQKKVNKEKNKERDQEYRIEYRETNKDKILAYKGEKLTCECGCIVRRDGMPDHKNTKKHLKLMTPT